MTLNSFPHRQHTRQGFSQFLFERQPGLPGDLNALGLWAACPVHTLGEVANGVASKRHILDEPQYPHASFVGHVGWVNGHEPFKRNWRW